MVLLALASTLISIATYTDVRWRIIPNVVTVPFFIIAISYNMILLHDASLLIGGLIMALVTVPLYMMSAIGAGDVKLFIVLGTTIGTVPSFHTMLLATLFTGLIAMLLFGVLRPLAQRLHLDRSEHCSWLYLPKSKVTMPFMIAVAPAFATVMVLHT